MDKANNRGPLGKTESIGGCFQTQPPDGSMQVDEMRDDTSQIEIPIMAKEMVKVETAKKLPCLVVLAGLDMGRIIPIHEGKMILGRGSECEAVFRDDGISRHHAAVELTDKQHIVIKDLNSTNGTFVSGRLVQAQLVEVGSKVLLGRNTVLKFVLQDEMDLQYQTEIYNSTTRDGLTGVFNRKHLMQKLEVDLSFARRHNLAFTFALFDLDYFKKINDVYGHQVGDNILVAVSRLVEKNIRTEDMLGRYGGEEFAVIAQGIDADGAQVMGERIRRCIADEPVLALGEDGTPVCVTVSVGVATLKSHTYAKAEDIISCADQNLYKAKDSGRNVTVAGIVPGYDEADLD